MDITSLYTVIPNNEGLQALRFSFDQRTIKEPSSESLLRLAELVLPLNCFSFADNHYKQVNGVAMGTKLGPSYANLFVGYIENEFFNQFNGTKPELYGLYIDDCVGATSFSREELDHFISSVNSFHPALKYTWEISKISIAFLDIKVSINGNGLSTSVHYTNLQIPTVICCLFSNKSEEMRNFFKKRGYPDSVVNTAQQIDRQSALQTSQKEKNKRIPFELTYHPHNLAAKINILKNFKLLQNDSETGRIF